MTAQGFISAAILEAYTVTELEDVLQREIARCLNAELQREADALLERLLNGTGGIAQPKGILTYRDA